MLVLPPKEFNIEHFHTLYKHLHLLYIPHPQRSCRRHRQHVNARESLARTGRDCLTHSKEKGSFPPTSLQPCNLTSSGKNHPLQRHSPAQDKNDDHHGQIKKEARRDSHSRHPRLAGIGRVLLSCLCLFTSHHFELVPPLIWLMCTPSSLLLDRSPTTAPPAASMPACRFH